MIASHTPPTLLSVCSGIGGLDLALERVLGAYPVGYVERDAYAQAVLLARMEDEALGCAPVWDDLRALDGAPLRGLVDIVAGGIPCQPHSVAGKQRRGDDERDLIDEFLRVVGEVGPRLVFVENVRGFVAGDGLGRLLGGLADLGFDAEWTTVQAADVGAPHKRERVFVLAYRVCDGLQGLVLSWAEKGPARRGGGAKVDRAEPWPPAIDGDWGRFPGWCWPAAEPLLRGVADGPPSLLELAMTYRTDRLRCLGNAVVPAQAEAALRLLLSLARSAADGAQ